jgi:crossover junction endodeoxyribonuclease RusA
VVTIRLPFPPSVNHYWCTRIITPRGGKRPFPQIYIGERGVRFRENVKALMLQRFGIIEPSTDRVSVQIVATLPDRRERDLDNLPKSVLDSLTHARVWESDNQVDRIEIIRGPVKSPGWLDVTIEPIKQTIKQGELNLVP